MTKSMFLKLVAGTIALVAICTVASKSNVCVEVPSGRYCSNRFFAKAEYPTTLTQPMEEDLSDTGSEDLKIIRLAEHTKAENTAYRDGSERFLVHVASSPWGLCQHWANIGTIDMADCVGPHPHKPIYIDFKLNDDVICIKNSSITGEDVCFSYYDITER